ncbi:YraN family protein [Pseudoalteromonas sp.]|uniref:YraN family protein n=1 Tax=Pseudoalteromonas sp. TaxID=53249 RepID=UPI003561697F
MGWTSKLFKNSTEKGNFFELQAEQYLKQQGLQAVTRNYSCRYGELDLVMNDGKTLVFVEVKYRKSNAFGGAINALSEAKKQKLTRTIYYYLKQNSLEDCSFRVDFVAINGQNSYQYTWIKSAF